ncbi:MAG: cobalamin-dependent protein [Rhodospirillales bacterium]|nr:cobalamin-dependent protein [Rhodospirillales bacterium]
MGRELFTIYLADLRYFTAGTSFPLSIGYLAAYIGKVLPQACDVRLFIDPEKLVEAIREAPPDLLGFANYSWNRNINTQITAFAKSVEPQIITVMGGPCFARGDQEWMDGFFERNQNLDFYLAGPGEIAFAEMVRLSLEAEDSRQEAIRSGAFPGLFFKDGDTVLEGECVVPSLIERRKTLDEIPSPYLLGLFDEFFTYENLGPMIETVRGCPYACTFCCWGSRMLGKVSMFSLDRVKAELDYVAERAVNCRRLFFGDANFGIIERDVEVAEHLLSIRQRRGWPDNVFLYFAKNSGDRVIQIASLLKDMTAVSMARQSMTELVLANTKRANLDDESYARIQEELGANNVDSLVEFIYPLPGETRASFIDGRRCA